MADDKEFAMTEIKRITAKYARADGFTEVFSLLIPGVTGVVLSKALQFVGRRADEEYYYMQELIDYVEGKRTSLPNKPNDKPMSPWR